MVCWKLLQRALAIHPCLVREGSGPDLSVYVALAMASVRRNRAYVWSHLANNVGSAFFGVIFIELWRAAARGRSVGGFASQDLVAYIALTQIALWISTFLSPYLGIRDHIRTGQVALEFARPVGYMPRILATGAGEVLYNAMFRCLPLALAFTLMGAMPWSAVASLQRAALVLLAFALAGASGLLFQYLMGIASFWTVDPRWARRLYLGLATFCGGQLVPLQLMPPALQRILTWMPFQTLLSLPATVWLGRDRPDAWVSAVLWTAALLGLAAWLTRAGARRLVVQGG